MNHLFKFLGLVILFLLIFKVTVSTNGPESVTSADDLESYESYEVIKTRAPASHGRASVVNPANPRAPIKNRTLEGARIVNDPSSVSEFKESTDTPEVVAGGRGLNESLTSSSSDQEPPRYQGDFIFSPNQDLQVLDDKSDRQKRERSAARKPESLLGEVTVTNVSKIEESPKTQNIEKAANSLSCSLSRSPGNYTRPIDLAISCNKTSALSICLKSSGCCDSTDSFSTYTSSIRLGQTDGRVCVSLRSVSQNEVYINSADYIFNLDFPDLSQDLIKVFYQTTELPGLVSLRSQDFGKSDHSVKLVNTFSHNPNIFNSSTRCQDLANSPASLSSPTPIVVMSDYSVDNLTPSQRIDIPLGISHLRYGVNHLSSIIKRSSSPDEILSCQTESFTLADFDYHNLISPAQMTISGSDYEEFVGSFNSFNFFEPETTVGRSIAGSSEDAQNNDWVLESGMISIFY